LWHRFRVTEGFRTPEGKRYREEIEAERLLARLDLFEEMAELAESEYVERVRERLCARYRELLGIEPERRSELKAALTRVADGTGAWAEVDDLLHSEAQQKGPSVSFRDESVGGGADAG